MLKRFFWGVILGFLIMCFVIVIKEMITTPQIEHKHNSAKIIDVYRIADDHGRPNHWQIIEYEDGCVMEQRISTSQYYRIMEVKKNEQM